MATSPCAPGEGPACIHEATDDAARASSGQNRASRQAIQPIQRQSERHGLRELIAANEDLHGPLTAEEIRAAEAKMFGDAGTQA